MRRATRALLNTFASLAFGLSCAPALAAQEQAEPFEFRVTTIDGEEISHEDFADKVVIVDFWGTWCPPCKKAIPHLIKLYQKYEPQGFTILGLNYEKVDDKLRAVRAYADKAGIPYPLALGTEEIKAQVQNFGGYPTMLFFRRGMRLDYQESGFHEDKVEAIEAWIVKALAEKKKPAPAAKPVKASLAASGGKTLEIGDGKTASLVVLVHPEFGVDAALMETLRGLASGSERLRLVTVTREDIAGVEADYRIEKALMRKVLRMGSAFPAYKLYDEAGNRRYAGVGRGATVHEELVAAVRGFLGLDAGGEKKAPVETAEPSEQEPVDEKSGASEKSGTPAKKATPEKKAPAKK